MVEGLKRRIAHGRNSGILYTSMNNGSPEGIRGAGPTQRSVELGVTLAMALFALIVIAGSMQVGIGWGPKVRRPALFRSMSAC